MHNGRMAEWRNGSTAQFSVQLRLAQFFFWRIRTSVVNFAPALRAPLHLSNLNSITSPIIVEAVGVIPCLLRSSHEVDCNLRV